jgi:hypothetical protein
MSSAMLASNNLREEAAKQSETLVTPLVFLTKADHFVELLGHALEDRGIEVAEQVD